MAKMEHRLFYRHPVDEPVALCQRGQTVAVGHLRNVSRSGAMVESATAPRISGGPLEIEFLNSEPQPMRLSGVVVHRDVNRLHVMLKHEWHASEWVKRPDGDRAFG